MKNTFSRYSIYFVLLVTAAFILTSKNWNNDNKIIASDVVSYYAYLPAAFIFNDIKLERQETFDKGLFWPEKLPDGNSVIKTSMGMSILYSPFFFASHFAAKSFGLDAYGYSPVYKIGLLLSAFFYFFMGLYFLQKTLKRYFSDKITALTIIAVTLGTNLLYYATSEATMTHVYNFTLINIFIWLTIKWYEKPKFPGLMILGLLAGLITLVRPSNIIVLVFFFLYGISSKDTFIQRLRFVFSRLHWFVLMAVAFTLVWIPQMIYWWSITGKIFVNSYPTERFYWGNPHIIDGLFSYRKGWLVYTPVMILAVIGIPFLFKKLKEFSWAITVFILLAMYIIFSWWCWWYGGSFGMRPFVDYYGVLAIPMALLFSELPAKKRYSKIIGVSLVLLAMVQSTFFMQKYKKGSLHYDSTSKSSFWHSFLHTNPQNGYWELLEKPDYKKALEGVDAIEK
jgi:hypothetical protein